MVDLEKFFGKTSLVEGQVPRDSKKPSSQVPTALGGLWFIDQGLGFRALGF